MFFWKEWFFNHNCSPSISRVITKTVISEIAKNCADQFLIMSIIDFSCTKNTGPQGEYKLLCFSFRLKKLFSIGCKKVLIWWNNSRSSPTIPACNMHVVLPLSGMLLRVKFRWTCAPCTTLCDDREIINQIIVSDRLPDNLFCRFQNSSSAD